jgi:hypothetical protein
MADQSSPTRLAINWRYELTINLKSGSLTGLITLVTDVLAVLAAVFPQVGHVVQQASILSAGLVTAGWVHGTKTSTKSGDTNTVGNPRG